MGWRGGDRMVAQGLGWARRARAVLSLKAVEVPARWMGEPLAFKMVSIELELSPTSGTTCLCTMQRGSLMYVERTEATTPSESVAQIVIAGAAGLSLTEIASC